MSRHIVMDPSGHSTFEFDTLNTTDLAEAERRFDKLVARGFIPVEVIGNGRHHVPHPADRKFDPTSNETLFVPALKGG
jgi:hypothetical protein